MGCVLRSGPEEFREIRGSFTHFAVGNSPKAMRCFPKIALATWALIVGQPCQCGCLALFLVVGRQGEADREFPNRNITIPEEEDGL